MNEKIGIGVAGFAGAGKTTIAQSLKEELDASYVRTGSIIDEKATEILGEGASRLEITKWIKSEVDKRGVGFIDEWVVEKFESKNEHTFGIIDGVRSYPTERIPNYFPNFKILLIHAPREIRATRIEQRNRFTGQQDVDSFLESRDKMESEFGLAEIYENGADYRINNGEDFEKTTQDIDRLTTELVDQLD